MVEQLAVNQLVAGSNPVPGAIKIPRHCRGILMLLSLDLKQIERSGWFGGAKTRAETSFEHVRAEEAIADIQSPEPELLRPFRVFFCYNNTYE